MWLKNSFSSIYFLSLVTFLVERQSRKGKKKRRKRVPWTIIKLRSKLLFQRPWNKSPNVIHPTKTTLDNHARTYISRCVSTRHWKTASRVIKKKRRGSVESRISIKPGLIKLSGEEEITGRIISIQMTSRRSWLKRCLLLLEREKVEGEGRGEKRFLNSGGGWRAGEPRWT